MDILGKILLMTAAGALLLALTGLIVAVDIAFVRLAGTMAGGQSPTIGSFLVAKASNDKDKDKGKDNGQLDEILQYLLAAHFNKTSADINSTTVFTNPTTDSRMPFGNRVNLDLPTVSAVTMAAPPIRSTDVSIKVGGVDVKGVLAWLQSLVASEKSLDFVVSFEQDKAVVTGNVAALSATHPYLHVEIENGTPEKIASRLAYALHQAKLADSEAGVMALDPADFQTVVETQLEVKKLDERRGRNPPVDPSEYAQHFDKIAAVVGKAPEWRKLREAQAAIAISARNNDAARQIYLELAKWPNLSLLDRRGYESQISRLDDLRKSLPQTTEAPAVLVRQDISKLNPEQLRKLREAFKKLYDDNSTNGFKFIAGNQWRFVRLHPDPKDTGAYLGSLRAFLVLCESALRRVDPDVSLPYWDWTGASGFPEAVKEGAPAGNPLAKGPLRLVSADGKVLQNRQTAREIPDTDRLALSPSVVDINDVLATDKFTEFEQRLETLSDRMHIFVGGDVANPDTAGFDPLSWFLEVNVDRIWALWQSKHPMPTREEVLKRSLAPFPYTLEGVLDTEKLGYKY